MNDVQKAANRLQQAKFALAVAVQKACGEGRTLRQVAKDAGISHEQVRRMTKNDR